MNEFTNALADENNLDDAVAQKISTWLINEGVLDYGVIKETYEGVSD